MNSNKQDFFASLMGIQYSQTELSKAIAELNGHIATIQTMDKDNAAEINATLMSYLESDVLVDKVLTLAILTGNVEETNTALLHALGYTEESGMSDVKEMVRDVIHRIMTLVYSMAKATALFMINNFGELNRKSRELDKTTMMLMATVEMIERGDRARLEEFNLFAAAIILKTDDAWAPYIEDKAIKPIAEIMTPVTSAVPLLREQTGWPTILSKNAVMLSSAYADGDEAECAKLIDGINKSIHDLYSTVGTVSNMGKFTIVKLALGYAIKLEATPEGILYASGFTLIDTKIPDAVSGIKVSELRGVSGSLSALFTVLVNYSKDHKDNKYIPVELRDAYKRLDETATTSDNNIKGHSALTELFRAARSHETMLMSVIKSYAYQLNNIYVATAKAVGEFK